MHCLPTGVDETHTPVCCGLRSWHRQQALCETQRLPLPALYMDPAVQLLLPACAPHDLAPPTQTTGAMHTRVAWGHPGSESSTQVSHHTTRHVGRVQRGKHSGEDTLRFAHLLVIPAAGAGLAGLARLCGDPDGMQGDGGAGCHSLGAAPTALRLHAVAAVHCRHQGAAADGSPHRRAHAALHTGALGAMKNCMHPACCASKMCTDCRMDSALGGCMFRGLHASHTPLLRTLQLLCCPAGKAAPHRLISL